LGSGRASSKDRTLGGDRARLAEALGRELAKVHAIRPPRADLAFLGRPEPEPARAEVARLRATLDALGAVRPSLEWGLRWAELHAPPCPAPTLVHRDFRTGNYMVDGQGLTGVLDWEFAGWGDPMSDLGWFCAECWRFGRPELEAAASARGPISTAATRRAAAPLIDDAAVRYWEIRRASALGRGRP
jgi:aminoglycoside phosphotransferase (APT) family kinase protein